MGTTRGYQTGLENDGFGETGSVGLEPGPP